MQTLLLTILILLTITTIVSLTATWLVYRSFSVFVKNSESKLEIQEKELFNLEESFKQEKKELIREKIKYQKECKDLKEKLNKKEDKSIEARLKEEVRRLTLSLVEREMEISKMEKVSIAIKEGKVPISKTVAKDLRDMVDSLVKKSTNIAFRQAGKQLISDIDSGFSLKNDA